MTFLRRIAAIPLGWMLLALWMTTGTARAAVVTPERASMVVSGAAVPPPADAPWRTVRLPDNWRLTQPGLTGATSWYRIEFEAPDGGPRRASWAVYLPYFYDGAQLVVNGAAVATIRGSDERTRVLWVRPHLVLVPDALIVPGPNVLMVRAAQHAAWSTLRFPAVSIGPADELLPLYERRLFWMRTLPQVTAVTSGLMSVFILFVWWRRPQETLYGLLGLASMLWGMRTMSFVIEQMPVAHWLVWRIVYWGSTAGFVVVLALFALRFSGRRLTWLERGLWAYWLVGPVVMWTNGADAEHWVGRVWAAGLIPIGVLVFGLFVQAAWRQRTWQAVLLLGAMLLSLAAGVHDYLVVANTPIAARLAPVWSGHRIYLLHLAANVLLLVMASILAARFIGTLNQVEELNRTLESRVAQRERQLAGQFEAMARLERDRAIEDERQRIMLDMHDGLGSQLLTSLARVERGAMPPQAMADALRGCIAEMRLALDALAPSEDDDFRSAFGNFRYRWDAQLADAGVQATWSIDAPGDAGLQVAAHQRLDMLRVLQEALTNVVKHAQARHVHIRVERRAGGLRMEVRDDGRGLGTATDREGHGLRSMRARAQRLGANLSLTAASPGTCVVLQLGPLATG